ncbi:MAG: hypothetical protein ABSC91_10450 [Candidatus Bathyarchaeia archaeon]
MEIECKYYWGMKNIPPKATQKVQGSTNYLDNQTSGMCRDHAVVFAISASAVSA